MMIRMIFLNDNLNERKGESRMCLVDNRGSNHVLYLRRHFNRLKFRANYFKLKQNKLVIAVIDLTVFIILH